MRGPARDSIGQLPPTRYGQRADTIGAVHDGALQQPPGRGQFNEARPRKIIVATLTGMTTEDFGADVRQWLASARDPRSKRPYTDLGYQPVLEVMSYLRERL